VLEKYPQEVKLVFKNFPLPSHRFATKAAIAALAANAQGKFREFQDALFKNYSRLDDAKIQQFATELGLDMEKFNRDMGDSAFEKLVARDMRDGGETGVRGVPTVFINGKPLKNRSMPGTQEMIAAELKRAGKSPQ
jgi:protein-disulfide isomerase